MATTRLQEVEPIRLRSVQRRTSQLREGAKQLARETRYAPPLSILLTQASSMLEAAEDMATEHVDATLTVAGEDELRRRAITDDAALTEIARRSRPPAVPPPPDCLPALAVA